MGADSHSLNRGGPGWWLAVVPLLFLGVLFIYPVVSILTLTLGEKGGLGEVLSDPRIISSAWFTLWQAAASTVLTMLVALPLTAVIARYRFAGRSLVRAVVTVPFVLPTVVVGASFLALGMEGSVGAILAAHVFYNLAVVVRTVGGVWSRLDPELAAAARTLGASPLRAFRRVTMPLLAPSLAAAGSIVFLFSFTSFGVVLLLGGLRYRTIEVEIYQQALTFLDLGAAGALALVQLIGMAVVMAVYSRYQETRAVRFRLVPESEALRPVRTNRQRWAVGSVVILTVGLQMIPLVLLVARSLAGGGAGWRFLADPGRLAIEPLDAIATSFGFAAVATGVALAVGIPAARLVAGKTSRMAGGFDALLMLPLGTSAVTIGFGFLVALGPLRTSWLLVPLAHALVAVPFVVRATVPTLRSIRPELGEAAATLGADPRRVWREIDLPLAARAIAVGAGFAAAVSLGEFGASSFIVRPDTTTIPTLIFRLLSRPGAVTYSAALALAVVLMLVTAGLILAVDRLRAGELGSF